MQTSIPLAQLFQELLLSLNALKIGEICPMSDNEYDDSNTGPI